MNEEQLTEYQHAMNSYVITYGEMFAKGLYRQGIIKDVTPEQLQKYFSNPEFYQDIIDDIANYFYIINAEIHQLFELIESSPRLDYTIKTFVKDKDSENNYLLLKKNLHKINHKRLTRDLLKQNTSYGNVVGMWLGDKNNLYPFIFNDLKYIVNPYRTNGSKWQMFLDMAFFNDMSEFERNEMLKQFNPHVTKEDYEKYRKGETFTVPLPIDRTFVLATGKLKRNHFNGTSWITPSMFDILHKRKLKDVEQTIANKIINAVAILTIGSFDGKESNNGDNLKRDYNSIPDKLVKAIHSNVKQALSEGSKEGMALVSIPNFAKLEFNDPDSEALDGNKFNQTNSDIRSGLGLSGTAMNGEGANYNSAKLNYDIFFSKLAVMLEDIDSEVYQRFFDLLLPVKQKGNFYMEYCKDRPLTLTEKLKEMKGLNDKGWSSRHYIEMIGMDYDSMLEQTKFEIESGLYEMLQPPKTSHTTSNDEIDNNGRPSIPDENLENENTIRNRETQG